MKSILVRLSKNDEFKEILKKTSNNKKIIENIDIGGPSMVRAAAKNSNDVVTVSYTHLTLPTKA